MKNKEKPVPVERSNPSDSFLGIVASILIVIWVSCSERPTSIGFVVDSDVTEVQVFP
jgi:hypothetical protein